MRPIQLWLPLLNVSWDTPSFSRDIQRAQREWLGEDKVWLLPGLKETKRWCLQAGVSTYKECAIPSESFNVITIADVSNNTGMYPPVDTALPKDWNGKLPHNLLDLWLNSDDPAFGSTNNHFKMNLPFFSDEKVFFREVDVGFSPGPSFPIADINEENNEIRLKWPPDDSNIIESISPEAESREVFGKYRWEEEPVTNGLNTVVNENGRKATHTILLWDFPFKEMFPLGGGMDLLNQKQQLKYYALHAEKNQNRIAEQVSKFTSQGWTTLENQLILPTLVTEGLEEVFFNIESRFNIEVDSFKDLLNHKKYDEVFREMIPVTRIFGWEGYFWWELNNLVNKRGKSIKSCALCGNIITGRIDKEFCSKTENSACFNKRKANSKRDERKVANKQKIKKSDHNYME